MKLRRRRADQVGMADDQIGRSGRVRRRVIPSIVALGVVGTLVVTVVHLSSQTSTRNVQLTSSEVRVTTCKQDVLLTGAADVVNPTHSYANLVFALEFYWATQNVGLVRFVAPHVAPGKHALVSNSGGSNILFTEKLLAQRPRLTCLVVGFVDGGILQPR